MKDILIMDCIEACNDCATSCLNTITHCLELGGQHAEPEHIQKLLDCVEICRTAANFIGRSSVYYAELCRICAEICDVCAESCYQVDLKNSQMRECAETCRQCSEACRQMAAENVA